MKVTGIESASVPERGYAVSKTRAGVPKVRLYLKGRKVLEQPVSSRAAGIAVGKAWRDS